jgi:predicted metal-dependent phosphoesterase TrpH
VFKTDLHTHSEASADGGITSAQYKRALHEGRLDYIAITDHNRIDFALNLQQELGEVIIVGEEIMTEVGEIIGLYLSEVIPAGLPALETIQQIQAQGGIVYIPHPFETVRKGLHPAVLEELAYKIDLIEVCNGRAFLQNRSEQAFVWAKLNHVVGFASSDAHGATGLGRTYTTLKQPPSRDNLVELSMSSTLKTERPGLRALLYPKYHRFKRKVRKQS